jgi:four helix bundle protein
MIKINYRNLNFYKKSHELTLEIYKITKNFPKEELYSLTNQLRRSVSSIPANISEGSAKTNKDFKRFLNIALGSAKETEYWLLLAKDLEYIPINIYEKLLKELNQIIGSIINYIKKINQ